jgi:uncharacterized protein DUF3551
MRTAVLIMMAIGSWLVVAPAGAQTYDPNYPVCMHVYSGASGSSGGGGGGWFECTFTSLEQCRASASGRAASCDINPYYAFNEPPPARRRHKKVY